MPGIPTAVVGASGGGQNVVRAFHAARNGTLRWVCDLNDQLLAPVGARLPDVRVTRSFDQVLADPEVRAVAIAVAAPNHYRLARLALEADRHVLVEKPLALTATDAAALCAQAEARDLPLMDGHLLH